MVSKEEFLKVFENMIVYANNPVSESDIASPSPENQSNGVRPITTLPAQWWNWFLKEATLRFNGDSVLVGNMVSEIENLMSICGLEATKNSATQLKDMFDTLYPNKILSTVNEKISDIQSKIPSNASKENQLADKGFVIEHISTNTANFRGEWQTWEDVPSDGSEYPIDYTGNHYPTESDYMVVRDSIGYGESYVGWWRFKYTGKWSEQGKNGWKPEYGINSVLDYNGVFGFYINENTGNLMLSYSGKNAPSISINESGHLVYTYEEV